MALSVELNGRTRLIDALSPGASLDELITALELRGDRIAVELNGEIVPRETRGDATIQSGDRLEVVHFVGGGFAESD